MAKGKQIVDGKRGERKIDKLCEMCILDNQTVTNILPRQPRTVCTHAEYP